MRHTYSTLAVGTLFKRAGAFGGASTIHHLAATAVGGNNSAGGAADDDDDAALTKQRAEYRAWRQGAHHYHHHQHTGKNDLLKALLEPPTKAPIKAPAPPTAACPSRIATDFEPHALLGKGAFGVVYSATSKHDGQTYALKMQPRDGSRSEARALGAIPPHPNLVRYHGAWSEAATVGELRAALAAEENWLNDDDDDEASEATGSTAASSTSKDDDRPPMLSSKGVASSGSLVLQLELQTTPTLHAILRNEMSTSSPGKKAADAGGGGQSVDAAPRAVRWKWIEGVASGLEHMHEHGYLHNDVKAANIFCGSDGHAKLGDMGLASPWPIPEVSSSKAGAAGAGAGSSLLNQSGFIAQAGGTPLYMAPERRRHSLLMLQQQQGEEQESSGSGKQACIKKDAVAAQVVPGPPSDVYSLGVVTAETFGGFSTAMERVTVLEQMKREAASSDSSSSSSEEKGSDRLVRGMLAVRPEARPTLSEVRREAASV